MLLFRLKEFAKDTGNPIRSDCSLAMVLRASVAEERVVEAAVDWCRVDATGARTVLAAGLPFCETLMLTAVDAGLTVESGRRASEVGVVPLPSVDSAAGEERLGEILGEVLGELSVALLTIGD